MSGTTAQSVGTLAGTARRLAAGIRDGRAPLEPRPAEAWTWGIVGLLAAFPCAVFVQRGEPEAILPFLGSKLLLVILLAFGLF